METPMEHQPVLVERSGRFFFHIEELGLVGSGEDVASAYADLRRRYDDLLSQAQAADLLDRMPPPRPRSAPSGVLVVRSDIKSFLIKTGVVVAAALAVLLPVTLSVTKTIGPVVERTIEKLQVKGGREFWAGLEKSLQALATADEPASAEQRKRIVANLHILAVRYKPYVDEVRFLFSDAPAGTLSIPHSSSSNQ